LFRYILHKWLQSVGAERLSVVGIPDKSNNGVENFHKQLKMRVNVSHPNLFVFLDHLRTLSVNLMLDVSRLQQHRKILLEDFHGAVKRTTTNAYTNANA